MVELTFAEPKGGWRDEPFVHGASNVLVQLIEGDDYRLPGKGVEFGEVGYTEGDAEIEQECGMLVDAVAPMLEDVAAVGWWLVESFTCHYTRDYYYGEWDCDYEHKGVRRARWSDYRDTFGPPPWWATVLLWFGIDREVPTDWLKPIDPARSVR